MTAQEDSAEFFDFTRRLLLSAKVKRNREHLARAEHRINSQRFDALSDTRQMDLLEQLAAAQMACGAVTV